MTRLQQYLRDMLMLLPGMIASSLSCTGTDLKVMSSLLTVICQVQREHVAKVLIQIRIWLLL